MRAFAVQKFGEARRFTTERSPPGRQKECGGDQRRPLRATPNGTFSFLAR
jgi:hypothetical protein